MLRKWQYGALRLKQAKASSSIERALELPTAAGPSRACLRAGEVSQLFVNVRPNKRAVNVAAPQPCEIIGPRV